MTIIEGDYKSRDSKDYYYAVINLELKNILIFKNFSCHAKINDYIRKNYIVHRYDVVGRKVSYSPSDAEISHIFKVEFLGDSADLTKISKKYSKFQVL